VLCTLGEVLLSFTLHCCGEVQSDKLANSQKMLRAQVISQQNTRTENQNIVTMFNIIKYFQNSIKNQKYQIFSSENIGYMSMIYIGAIYQADPDTSYIIYCHILKQLFVVNC